MSSQLRVETQKDENGRLNWIKIFKGRSKKPLRLDYIWDAEGLTREIQFSGRRQDMLSIPQVASLINEKFMERIGLVKVIETVETIETIETIVSIDNIKNIDKLDTIVQTVSVKTTGTNHVDIDVVSSITLNINIASSAITLNIHETGTAQVDITSSIQLNVNIAASAITVDVHETGTANVAITSSVQLDMNIAASAITVNVHEAGTANVSITSSITVDMNITGATVNVPVETAEGAKVDVNIISTITLNVNLHAQTANINVDIKAQTVDLNIKTSGGANIIIDQLVQGAYMERRSTISNNGASPNWTSDTGNNRSGKFFTRGCMGFISSIDVYCKSVGVAGTITVYISPNPSLGYVASAVIDVGAGVGEGWRGVAFNRMWNYDKLFVFVVSSHANVQYGFDAEDATKHDSYTSSDAGATWTVDSYRKWFRVLMKGQTIGDVNVAGTVNNIEIPHTSSGENTSVLTALPNGAETTVMTVYGAGHMDWFSINVSHDDIELKIYCDGKLAFWDTPGSMNGKGIDTTTPGVQLTIFTEGAGCEIQSTLRFEFKRKLMVACRNDTGAEKNATVYNSLITMLD